MGYTDMPGRFRTFVSAGCLAAVSLAVVLYLGGGYGEQVAYDTEQESAIDSTASAILPAPLSSDAMSRWHAAPAAKRPTLVQSGYSAKCATNAGLCIVAAQPVNSVCFCGGFQGFIVP